MSALVEYGAERVTDDDGDDAWLPRVWVNGEPHDLPGEEEAYVDHSEAVADATEEAISVGVAYLGRGGVTVRMRVESPAPLSMESTVAELSAECVRLGVVELSAGPIVGKTKFVARARCGSGTEVAFHSAVGPDMASAILEALRRVGGER